MLRFYTAGESHGQALVATVMGLPAHVPVDFVYVNRELKRRMGGYGRGGRMKIETDRAHIVSGVRIEHGNAPEAAMVRQAIVGDAQGERHAAKLIEFP